jgi:hypothetical protein
MSVTAPNGAQFRTTQPGGTGDHTPHNKLVQGTGDGASGTIIEINDSSDANRLAVGGSSLGNPGDPSTANSVIGRLKNLLSRWPATLTTGGWIPIEIMADNSGVPTGQAPMAQSVPVTLASDQTPGPGQTPFSLLSAASQNPTVVKGSAGTLFGGSVYNDNTATRYLKIYDKATAPASTDVPKYRVPVPGGAHVFLAGMLGTYGAAFTLGIGIRTTTGVADNDTGNVAANELVINLTYR